jgi:hypothetical protein
MSANGAIEANCSANFKPLAAKESKEERSPTLNIRCGDKSKLGTELTT